MQNKLFFHLSTSGFTKDSKHVTDTHPCYHSFSNSSRILKCLHFLWTVGPFVSMFLALKTCSFCYETILQFMVTSTPRTHLLFPGNRPQYVLTFCNANIRPGREDNLSAGGHDYTSGTSLLVVGGDSYHYCHAFDPEVDSLYGSSFFLLGCDRHEADYTLAPTSARCSIALHMLRISKLTNPSA